MSKNIKREEDIELILKESKIEEREVTEELKKSFISYAMAVNVSRAIPDVRDGLKPVHRRILYAMDQLGNTYDKPHKKSARIVGEVLGKYHPHGDTAVYDALVRMAQDFSIRNVLIDGHGNFGSVDGDSPAAMRYTEARMSKLASELLKDIDKNTVDTYPNFDDTLQQPVVLPAKYPNLLVNGADGIAVAMTTNIPPHNLNEVIDATVALIDDSSLEIEDLMQYIKAPDFPTGGIILGLDGVIKAYKTGSGNVIIRSKVEIEENLKTKQKKLIIKEIPYQVNKEALIKQIHELSVKNKIEGISEVSEQSDREGMRIEVYIKKQTDPQYVLNQLFKHTRLQTSNSIKLLALVDGVPMTLNLKQILQEYIKHQVSVITRRTQFDLNKALEKEHILKGYVIALDHIEEVIKTIRESLDNKEAQEELIKRFDFSERQANAILEMKLKRLTSLEIGKIKEELEELKKQIEYYKKVLSDINMVYSIIKTELLDIKTRFNEKRRSDIEDSYEEIDNEDLIEREDVVITISHDGYIKKMPVSEYKTQSRGGVGTISQKTKDNDYTENIISCNTHDYLLYFTSKGKVYRTKAYVIPTGTKNSKGRAIVNLIQLEENEKVKSVLPVNNEKAKYIVLTTKKGRAKRLEIKEFQNINRNGKKALVFLDNDELINAHITTGENEILIASAFGKILRFEEKNLRPQGRSATGVKTIKLQEESDYVVDSAVILEKNLVLTITEKGKGKINKLEDFRKTSRTSKGVIAGKTTEDTGKIVCVKLVDLNDDIIIVTNKGVTIRIGLENLNIIGRQSQGVILKKCKDDEIITSVTIIEKDNEAAKIE